MYATYKNTDDMRKVYRAMKQKLIGIGSDLGPRVTIDKQNKRITCPDAVASVLEEKSELLAKKYQIRA